MIDVSTIVNVAREAGALIIGGYQRDFVVLDKADQSPLTEVDVASRTYIVAALQKLMPDIPVLSEESASDLVAQRMALHPEVVVDASSMSVDGCVAATLQCLAR